MQETRALLLDWMDTCVVVRQPPSRVKSWSTSSRPGQRNAKRTFCAISPSN